MIRKFTIKINGSREKTSDLLVDNLHDCDITFLNDGSESAIVTTEQPLGVIKQMLRNTKIKPMETTRMDIKHRADESGKEPTTERINKSDLI